MAAPPNRRRAQAAALRRKSDDGPHYITPEEEKANNLSKITGGPGGYVPSDKTFGMNAGHDFGDFLNSLDVNAVNALRDMGSGASDFIWKYLTGKHQDLSRPGGRGVGGLADIIQGLLLAGNAPGQRAPIDVARGAVQGVQQLSRGPSQYPTQPPPRQPVNPQPRPVPRGNRPDRSMSDIPATVTQPLYTTTQPVNYQPKPLAARNGMRAV